MSMVGSCSYCLSALAPDDQQAECGECHGRYHPECWEDNGGCATFGCSQSAAAASAAGRQAPAARMVGGFTTGGVALAVAHFCDQCGTRVQPTDVSCPSCRSNLYEETP
jgi:hypothetical protein